MVDAFRLPEVPLMVMVAGPVRAVLLAVSVSTLDLAAGLVAKAAVTPVGRPVAASVTLPVNPPASVTEMVSVELAPWMTVSAGVVGASVKLGGTTVRARVVIAVRVPDVPVMVTVAAPAVAVLLAVSVSTLELVAGFFANEAVTPLGRPVAARVTLPVNPPMSVMEMVSVEAPP